MWPTSGTFAANLTKAILKVIITTKSIKFSIIFVFNSLLYVKSVIQFTVGEDYEGTIIKQLNNNETDLILTPLPPMSLSGFSKSVQLSRFIGDNPMMAILSAKTQIKSTPILLKIFSFQVWINFIFAFVLVSTFQTIIYRNFHYYFINFAILLKQNSGLKNRIDFIQILWIFSSFVLMSGFSGIVLSFLIMKPNYHTIDSIEDLVQKGIEFSVFEGENAEEYVKDPKEPYYEKLHSRYHSELVQNYAHEEWNRNIAENISKGDYGLITDQTFIDHLLFHYSKEFPNLYRSSTSRLVLPYFLGLAKHNTKDFVNSFNKM